MGCDIHVFIEKKEGDIWKKVPDEFGPKHEFYKSPNINNDNWNINCWDVTRNYSLFGMLAGVRSFDVRPIADPRGLPKDTSEEIRVKFSKEIKNYGCHTPSFFTLQELLKYKNKTYTLKTLLDPLNYKKFLEGEGEIDISSGYQCKVISRKEMKRLINLSSFIDSDKYVTKVSLKLKYGLICKHFWEEIIPCMQKLSDDPSKVRMVFWFDS